MFEERLAKLTYFVIVPNTYFDYGQAEIDISRFVKGLIQRHLAIYACFEQPKQDYNFK